MRSEFINFTGIISINAKRKEDKVIISISDNGLPIPKEIRPTLFKAFIGTKGNNSSGLGLAISAELCQANGGTLELGEDGKSFILTIKDSM